MDQAHFIRRQVRRVRPQQEEFALPPGVKISRLNCGRGSGKIFPRQADFARLLGHVKLWRSGPGRLWRIPA